MNVSQVKWATATESIQKYDILYDSMHCSNDVDHFTVSNQLGNCSTTNFNIVKNANKD